MTGREQQDFDVKLDDWLAIYTFKGGDLDKHQSIRSTEHWSDWNHAKDYKVQEPTILERARQLGPPSHDTLDERGEGWCGICAAQEVGQ